MWIVQVVGTVDPGIDEDFGASSLCCQCWREWSMDYQVLGLLATDHCSIFCDSRPSLPAAQEVNLNLQCFIWSVYLYVVCVLVCILSFLLWSHLKSRRNKSPSCKVLGSLLNWPLSNWIHSINGYSISSVFLHMKHLFRTTCIYRFLVFLPPWPYHKHVVNNTLLQNYLACCRFYSFTQLSYQVLLKRTSEPSANDSLGANINRWACKGELCSS